MNNLEITGKVIQILPLQEGVSKAGKPWKSQMFVLETGGQYPKKVPIKLFGDYVDRFPLQVGQDVTASLDIDGREWEGKWFAEVRAWNIVYQPAQQVAQPTYQQPPAYQPQPTYQQPQPQPAYQQTAPQRQAPAPAPAQPAVADDLPF